MKLNLLMTTTTILTFFLGGISAYGDVASTSESDKEVTLVAGEGGVTPPVGPLDPIDPDNPGTGQLGPLSIDYVSNLKFGEHKIAGGNMSYKALNKDPYIQVTDLRGAGEGWSLSAKMSNFVNEKNQVLKGATLSMTNGKVKAASPDNVSLIPQKSNVIFDNEQSQLVMQAPEKSGRGTWILTWAGMDQANEEVQLNVIAGTPEANTEYNASIIWELEDAPK